MTIISEITAYRILKYEYDNAIKNINSTGRLISVLRHIKSIVQGLLIRIKDVSIREVLIKQLNLINKALFVLKVRYLIYAFYKRIIKMLLNRLKSLIYAIM
ncbi:MAG: hypothetical protein OWQ54_03950 [Sulfolobaceae archaeon]|nr:hypothetical protein [Sulfolobaceae archaeon]